MFIKQVAEHIILNDEMKLVIEYPDSVFKETENRIIITKKDGTKLCDMQKNPHQYYTIWRQQLQRQHIL